MSKLSGLGRYGKVMVSETEGVSMQQSVGRISKDQEKEGWKPLDDAIAEYKKAKKDWQPPNPVEPEPTPAKASK